MADSNSISLLKATYDGEAAKVCLLLNNSDAYIEARDDDGQICLLLAAVRGYGGNVALLLLEGAAVDAADIYQEVSIPVHFKSSSRKKPL